LAGLTLEQASVYPPLDATPPTPLVTTLSGLAYGTFGLPALVLPLGAAAIVAAAHRVKALFFLALMILTLDFMRGTAGIVYRLYFELPLGNLFRAPTRISFVYHFAAAVLIGLGASACVSRAARARRLFLALSIALPLAVGADVLLRNSPVARYDPLVAPESLYRSERLVDLKARAGYERIFIEAQVPAKLGSLHGLFTVPDYEPNLPSSYREFFDVPQIWHGLLRVVPLTPKRSHDPVLERVLEDPRLLDLMSVRYYVSAARNSKPLQTAIRGRRVLYGRPAVFERSQALPRVYVVHRAIESPSEAEALRLVRTGGFDRREEAVVVGPIPELEPLRPGAEELARISLLKRNRVDVEAECASACLVVLTDLFDPNWKGSLDGSPTEILRVNYLFRGVTMPAGKHRIEFRYRPRSFQIGAAISLVTAFAAGAIVIRRRSR
jgi:hypothetical protein